MELKLSHQEIQFLLEEFEIMLQEGRSKFNTSLIADIKEKLQEYEGNI